MSFLYTCGCAADQVGQKFLHGGVLVCPVHDEPVATGPAAEGPWRGTATIVVGIEAHDREQAALFLDRLGEQIVDAELVKTFEQSLVEAA